MTLTDAGWHEDDRGSPCGRHKPRKASHKKKACPACAEILAALAETKAGETPTPERSCSGAGKKGPPRMRGARPF